MPQATQTQLPIRAAILWGLGAFVLALVFTVAVVRNIAPASDLWDYSQEARQLARGQGFTSLYTYPTHLGRDEEPPFPVRWRQPLYAARGAVVLNMGAPLPLGYLLFVAQAHAALVAFVFLLGAHFMSPRAGAIAAATALACPLFLDAFSPGMSQVPVAAVSALVWLLLLRWRGMATTLLAAILAAGAWYLRGESILMAPIWAWVAGRERRSRAVMFGALYLALLAPWPLWLHGATGAASSIQGNPMLLYTPEYPGYSSARSYGHDLPAAFPYVLTHPITFAVRWVKDALGFGLDLAGGIGPLAVGLAIAGLLLRDAKERYAPLRPTVPFAIAIAVQIMAFAALERSPRFLVPVAPLICVMIGIAAAPALDRICGRRALLALFALLIAERALTVGFQTREAPRRFLPIPAETATTLAAATTATDPMSLILSDVPDWVAWHLDRPALLLPMWRDMEALERDHPVSAIFLSPAARARNVADADTTWVHVIDGSEPIPGFNGPAILRDGSRVYVRSPSPRR
ncbi:MAG TPA: hypothetical protein VGQ14_00695 [Candidatus Eisenbacteria bacterium]|nr:hypothetical protein [Candidatus Eisenbacteria bacterium]